MKEEKSKAKIYKLEEKIDITGRTIEKKVVEVEGENLKEAKKIFDEKWKE